jgi:trimethylamine--corrinoid protein Co-methyltransferase
MIQFAELLAPEQVARVHEASLEILEQVGLLVRNEEARALFARHGGQGEIGSEIVRLPRAVVEDALAACPSTFTFHGRDPDSDCTVPGDGPLLTNGSSAPDIQDPDTGQVRRARSDDIARIARLVDALPGFDILSLPVTADDAPPGQYHLSRFYPALKNCRKPVRGSAPSVAEGKAIVEMGGQIAGSEAAFAERPFVVFLYCALVSPLTMDRESTEKLLRFTEWQVPSFGVVVPNAGLTAPLTLVGTLAQANAEFLAQLALVQMVRPGTPQVYDVLPTMADMRTVAYAPGAIETGMLMIGCAQMARYYRVPCSGFVGLTNAKLNDAQSGFETGMSTVAGLLGGADLMAMGGLLDALMTFDYAKLAIDGEIALMLKRLARGLGFSVEDLALDQVAAVGPGGNFVETRHTLRRARTAGFLPAIADREMRHTWQAAGARDSQARALDQVRDILRRDNPAVFSPDVDARIRARFEGLVAGDSLPL